jgi:tetratricopeptide (TPR) repeat protein
MKNRLALLLVITAIVANAQSTPAPVAELSPAQRSIAAAQSTIREKPSEYTSYNSLASALIQRARETDDSSYYIQAEETLNKSLQLSSNNFETEKIRVSILLGEHDYATALNSAKLLNQKTPDDVLVYGLLADANAALGNYKEAEIAAQWMLDLHPGNRPALLHAAALRELFGDPDGSYELLDMAYQMTPASEIDERARILTQMGNLRLSSGNTEAAEKLLRQALEVFPNYPYAVSNLGLVRVAQKRYEEAVVLFRQRCNPTLRAACLYDLGEAMHLAGHDAESNKEFAEFESKALIEASKKDNSNLALILYYADYAKQPAKALQLAQREYGSRHDVYTLDAYAWALHVNGQDTEARKQIEAAITVGMRDARLYRHAGEIALKLGDATSAQRYLKQAAELNAPGSEQAVVLLASIQSKKAK